MRDVVQTLKKILEHIPKDVVQTDEIDLILNLKALIVEADFMAPEAHGFIWKSGSSTLYNYFFRHHGNNDWQAKVMKIWKEEE